MQITFFLLLILFNLSLLILALPKAESPPYDLNGNYAVKRIVAQVPSVSQLLNETQPQPNSNITLPNLPSLLLAEEDYNVTGTPMELGISLKGPPVPQILISACLTSALCKIAPNVTTRHSAPIPDNRFNYRDRVTGVMVEYRGFISLNWLTWQQLSWLLYGVLTYVEESEVHARNLEAWVKIRGGGDWAIPYGTFTLGYDGNGISEER